jgi:biopolymer transport protein ExbD
MHNADYAYGRGALAIRRSRRRLYKANFQNRPMDEINTTPLIDVMLVLLIMIMITLPLPTHKVPVDLPQPGATNGTPPKVDLLEIQRNGALSWNGEALGQGGLTAKLRAHAADQQKPVLHIKSDPEASYERFDQTLAVIRSEGVTRLGFVDAGNATTW